MIRHFALGPHRHKKPLGNALTELIGHITAALMKILFIFCCQMGDVSLPVYTQTLLSEHFLFLKPVICFSHFLLFGEIQCLI